MDKSKKIKIFIGLFYLSILVSLFLFYTYLKNLALDEITSYKFIQQNREYFFSLKETNLILISFSISYL